MSSSSASIPKSTSETVAHNLVWTIADLAMAIGGMLIVNISMARVIGPTALGYFNYIFLLTNFTGQLGSLGLPVTTCKYMAEFIGSGNKPQARAVFFNALTLQTIFSTALTAVAVVLVLTMGDRNYRTASLFLVLSLLPQMVAFIPSQANNAREDMRANVPASVIGIAINIITVLVSLLAGWGLTGVAIGVFVSRMAEMAIKLIQVLGWIGAYGHASLSADIKHRLLKFSTFSTVAMLLQLIVWDRSDIVLLRYLQPDLRQITFFSLSFGLADRLLRLPQALGNAVSVTQMAEYGRDKQRLLRITATTATYILIAAAPILLASAMMSGPAVLTMYGAKYMEAVPVFALVAVFAIPKALTGPAQTLLYSTEDVPFIVKWTAVCGVANLALDCLLIPKHGAAGAAIGNGVAQTLAAAGMWYRAIAYHKVSLDWTSWAKAVGAALATAALVWVGGHAPFRPAAQFLISILVACAVLPVTLRVMRVLNEEDGVRARSILRKLPLRFQRWPNLLINFAVGGKAASCVS